MPWSRSTEFIIVFSNFNLQLPCYLPAVCHQDLCANINNHLLCMYFYFMLIHSYFDEDLRRCFADVCFLMQIYQRLLEFWNGLKITAGILYFLLFEENWKKSSIYSSCFIYGTLDPRKVQVLVSFISGTVKILCKCVNTWYLWGHPNAPHGCLLMYTPVFLVRGACVKLH